MLGWAEGLEVHRDPKKTMRRVLEWGAVPTMIPEIFDALIARRDRDHLELVVLRVLGYEGRYGSRLSAQGSP